MKTRPTALGEESCVTARGRRPREGGFDRRMTWMARMRKSGREWRRGHGAVAAQSTLPPCAGSPSSAKSVKSAVPSLLGDALGHPSWALRAAPQPSRLRGWERRPAEHAEGRRTGRGPRRAQTPSSPRGGPLGEVCFVAVVAQSTSRCCSNDGFAETLGCHHPQPPSASGGAGTFGGRGTGGGGMAGLTPATVLKPFQGFEDGLGEGAQEEVPN